jgi:two-component system, LytTR family, response regulator AlgR
MNTATTPMRILIVDDEAPARKRLSNLLDDCRDSFSLVIADEAANGVEAIEMINKGNIDIVLCDIRMPIMDGIEFARHLATLPAPAKLIFTTAFDQYAVKAFELNAVDYLLKPIKQERLLAALQKARTVMLTAANAIAQATQHRRKHLAIHERGKVVLVPIDDILYLKAELKYVTVRTLQKEYLLEESLTKLEDELAGLFTRIHRNAIVATKAITGFERASNSATNSISNVTAQDDDAEALDSADAANNGGHWVCLIKGIPEKLMVSRRQQHVIRSF